MEFSRFLLVFGNQLFSKDAVVNPDPRADAVSFLPADAGLVDLLKQMSPAAVDVELRSLRCVALSLKTIWDGEVCAEYVLYACSFPNMSTPYTLRSPTANGGEQLLFFMRFLATELAQRRNFEVVESLLAAFLRVC